MPILREILKKQKAALPYDFKYLGTINLKDTLKNLNKFTEEQWLEHSYRSQDFKAHNKTNTLEILWDPTSLRTGNQGKRNTYNYNLINFDQLKEQLQPIYTEHYGPGWFIRVLIPRLAPGGSIPPHCDGGKSLMEVKRTHIPLVTNDDIIFKVGDTTKNLKAGEVWEINNAKEHAVSNNSEEYRIHLIVDYLPKS